MVVRKTITTRRRLPKRIRPAVTTTVTTVGRNRRRNRKGRRMAMKSGGACPDGSKYVKCVLGVDQGAAKIPDGSTHYSAAVEYRSSATITPVNGKIIVACLPGLPGALRVMAGAGTFTSQGGGTTTFTDVGSAGGTVAFIDFTGSAALGDYTTNSVARIEQARVVKYDLEVLQVGPVLNQQGNAVTARVPYRLGTEIPQYFNLVAAGALYPGLTFPNLVGVELYRALDGMTSLTYDNVSTYPNSRICSATETCKMFGIPAHSEYSPTHSIYRPVGVDANLLDSAPFTGIVTLAGGATGGWGGTNNAPFIPVFPNLSDDTLTGDFWTPDDMEALVWSGANLGDGTSFEVRVSMCVEFVVSHTASIYRPIISPPAKRDDMAIQVVEDIGRVMPASIPATSGSSGWWANLTNAVTGIGEIVSQVGIPVVSPVAAVATRFLKTLGL